MKRLFYAIIVLILLVSISVYSHVAVDNYCQEILTDLKNFSGKKISADTLTKSWRERKEKMSAYGLDRCGMLLCGIIPAVYD